MYSIEATNCAKYFKRSRTKWLGHGNLQAQTLKIWKHFSDDLYLKIVGGVFRTLLVCERNFISDLNMHYISIVCVTAGTFFVRGILVMGIEAASPKRGQSKRVLTTIVPMVYIYEWSRWCMLYGNILEKLPCRILTRKLFIKLKNTYHICVLNLLMKRNTMPTSLTKQWKTCFMPLLQCIGIQKCW